MITHLSVWYRYWDAVVQSILTWSFLKQCFFVICSYLCHDILLWCHVTSCSQRQSWKGNTQEQCVGAWEKRGLAQGEMPETCLSGLCMSCGTVCILASTLIWQEGPGAFDLWSLLTSTWQFEAPGKGSVGRACDELSVPQWITAGFALDAGASSERMLEAVPAEPLAGSGFFGWSRDRRNLLFYVETNVPTNLGQQWEFPLQKKNVKESPGWMGGNGILAASLLNVTCIICLERNGKEREVS